MQIVPQKLSYVTREGTKSSRQSPIPGSCGKQLLKWCIYIYIYVCVCVCVIYHIITNQGSKLIVNGHTMASQTDYALSQKKNINKKKYTTCIIHLSCYMHITCSVYHSTSNRNDFKRTCTKLLLCCQENVECFHNRFLYLQLI